MGGLNEVAIAGALIKVFSDELFGSLDADVAIVGACPAGLTAARYLAKAGFKASVFERKLYVGGGMWGGGLMFPFMIIQEKAKPILEDMGLRLTPCGDGLYVARAVEAVSKCASAAIDVGARIWVGMDVEDVVIHRENGGYRVCGVVVNWEAARAARFHVDPIGVRASIVIDATGHDSEVVRTVAKKIPELKLHEHRRGGGGEAYVG